MDRVTECSEKYVDCALAKFSSRSFSLLLIQDGEVGNSCLPFPSMKRLKSAIPGLNSSDLSADV